MQFSNLENQKTKMKKQENALIWLYCKTWGKFGDHVIEHKELWNFGADDLESAIMGLAYQRKRKPNENEKTKRVEALTVLIMEKFEHDRTAFYEWSAKIHGEVIETLPETVDIEQVAASRQQKSSPTIVKILEWDPGKYLRLLFEYF